MHSSDDGMEFYLQSNLFFSEFRKQLLLLSLDMLVNIPKGLEDKYMNFLCMIQV